MSFQIIQIIQKYCYLNVQKNLQGQLIQLFNQLFNLCIISLYYNHFQFRTIQTKQQKKDKEQIYVLQFNHELPFVFNSKELAYMENTELQIKDVNQTYQSKSNLDQFAKIVQTQYYIDKSGLLLQIAKIQQQVIAIHRPKKFGKSVNARMIYHFCNKIVNNKQNNQAQFVFNKERFPELQIFKNQNEAIKKLYKNVPCLFLDFKKLHPKSYIQGVKLILKQIISNSALEILKQNEDYLKIVENINYFVKLQSKQLLKNSSNIGKMHTILWKISQIIQKIYDNSIFIIIDNYSSPIEYMMMNQVLNPQTNYLICFLKSLFESYAHSKGKLFLTGVIDILSSFDAAKYGTLEKDFYYYYGFRQSQINTLITKYSLQENRNQLYEEICNWYSYLIQVEVSNQKNRYENKKEFYKFFQPFSVQQYLEECMATKKVQKGSIQLGKSQFNSLFNFLKQKDMLEIQQIIKIIKIIQNYEAKNKKYNNFISVPFEKQCQVLKDYLNNKEDKNCKEYQFKIKRLMTVCFLSNGIFSGVLCSQQGSIDCYIPNMEMLTILKNHLKNQLNQQGLKINYSQISLLNKQIIKQDMQILMNSWNTIMKPDNYDAMFFIRYGLSNSSTHQIFYEQYCRKGNFSEQIGNAFFPLRKQNSICYIHQYKILQNMNVRNVQQALQMILTQIFCSGYLNWGIKKNQENLLDDDPILVNKFIIRPIIFSKSNIQKKQIKIKIFQFQYTIQEAKNIIYFFNKPLIQNIVKNNDDDFQLINQQILSKSNKNCIEQLVNFIKYVNQKQIDEYVQYIADQQKRYRQFLTNFTVQIGLLKNFGKLRLDKLTNQLFNYSEKQLIEISSIDNPLTEQQAKQLKSQFERVLEKTFSDNQQIFLDNEKPRKRKNKRK